MRILFIIATLALGAVPAYPADSDGLQAPEELRIVFDDTVPEGQREYLRQMLIEAHSALSPLAPIPFTRTVRVEWAATSEDFERRVNITAEHTMAAAEPARGRIIINGIPFTTSNVAERRQTMTHEYVHLFFGLYLPDPLPLWLEEGLAMHVSGDFGMAATEWQLTMANTFGNLISLRDLMGQFPTDPNARSLAYRQAYSATRFYIEWNYPNGDARDLITELMNPRRRDQLLLVLWDPLQTRALHEAWSDSVSSIWNWIIVFTRDVVFWLLICALCVFAFLKRKYRDKKIMDKWEEEEAWRESVPIEEYGGAPEDEQ